MRSRPVLRSPHPAPPGHIADDNGTVHRTALFSRDRRFRYRLGRRWGDGAAVCLVLLNPSTADETREDPIVRRCIGFAQSLGYGALDVVNLYAYVATDPAELRRAGYPVGGTTTRTSRRPPESASAWCWRGACMRPALGRPRQVLALFAGNRCGAALPEAHGGRPPGASAAAAAGVRACALRARSGRSGVARGPHPAAATGRCTRGSTSSGQRASTLVCVLEADSDSALAAFALAVAAQGNVCVQTLRAYSAGEMDAILAKLP
jgi:hypothetical protein